MNVYRPVRTPWRLIVLGMVSVALACTSRRSVTGTYELETVNGHRLPVGAGSHSEGGAEIVGGSVTLNRDGFYRHRILLRVRYDTLTYADSAVQVGQYKTDGRSVVLKTPSGNMQAQVADSVLTIELEGWRYRFRIHPSGHKGNQGR